jgi:hypothetical protein
LISPIFDAVVVLPIVVTVEQTPHHGAALAEAAVAAITSHLVMTIRPTSRTSEIPSPDGPLFDLSQTSAVSLYSSPTLTTRPSSINQ